MTLLELAQAALDAAKALGHGVHNRESPTVQEARQVVRLCREAEGWLQGVREQLEV